MRIYTCTQLETILHMALALKGHNIKNIAEMAKINLNTLYKWNCGAMHFSHDNIDKLLIYFFDHEPARLDHAEKVYEALHGIE